MVLSMASVTTGLISPNAYGLSSDKVSKMAVPIQETSDYFRSVPVFAQQRATSSDSEPETGSYHHHQSPSKSMINGELPKRNKRKNFKPRCSNVSSYSDNENDSVLNLSDSLTNNNNNNKNSPSSINRRRKTLSTRRVVLDPRFSPMDLSKNVLELSDSGSDDSEFVENYEDDENDDLENASSENDSKLSNFSIQNLSKPHVSDFASATSGLSHGQLNEMRDYAMNTMRELLSIYGLTSEVAESISRQLPMAAFNSGKILENLTLEPSKSHQGPPSQPPTPPSTPLSPKISDLPKFSTPSSFPNIPNLTITQSTAVSSASSSNQTGSSSTTQKAPLNLEIGRKKSKSSVQFSNGGNSSKGLDLSAVSSHQHPDFNPFSQQFEDGLMVKMIEGKEGKSHQNNRGYLVQFGALKSEGDSPPPMETNPLNAMMAQSLAPTQAHRDLHQPLLINKTQSQMDYSKYVKKFSSSLECGSSYCKDLNYREHFHCLDCNSRVFIKKEEMIRHFKWHKKRDESLQHGFMRYSPLDDCSDRYGNCTHNKKQTHYHCIKEGCDKVYISTSDVQMHANYHRKDSAIIQEGFQRYRATEECGASYCAFFGQRTTHFHCRRAGCRFTFKNKSDMEKHKSYHIKDEQLSRDGFKKFMKNESCPYENCRFSKVCNHIHCIRPQCNYVLHSSGQLFSHKRKHERKDSELAYRKYKLAQSMMKSLQDGGIGLPFPGGREYEQQFEGLNLSLFSQNSSNLSTSETLSERNSPISYDDPESSVIDLSANESSVNQMEEKYENPNWNSEDFWKKYCQFFSNQERCLETCEYLYNDHYHCFAEHCNMVFNCKDGVREHARNHEQQEQITENYFTTAQNGGCEDGCIYEDKEKHYHCNWENCREVILPNEKPFRRLEHYKMHEYSKKLSLTKDPLTMTHLATSIDGMFCRKRGRPPKNRVIEVWNDYAPMGSQSLMDSPQAIFTSFKLPKPSTVMPQSNLKEPEPDSNDERSCSPPTNVQDYSLQGFDIYNENTKCTDTLCPYLGNVHYHCNQNRCLYVTDKEDVLLMHSKDFHDNIEILDGFEFYDRNVDCRLQNCPSNKVNRHFHCTRLNCNYSFVQYSTMAVHQQKHNEEKLLSEENNPIKIKNEFKDEDNHLIYQHQQQFKAMNLSSSQSLVQQSENKISVVKASGTFYPLSTVPSEQKLQAYDTKSTPSEPPQSLNQINDPTSTNNTLYSPEISCSRPFCKLKRKYHYHCNACNQAFSEIDKLMVHVAKHSSGVLNQEDNNNSNNRQSPEKKPPPSQQQQQQPPPEMKINVAPLQTLQQTPIQMNKSDSDISPQQQQQSAYLTPSFDAAYHFGNFPANLATQFALINQQSMQNPFLHQTLYQNQLMFQHSGLIQSGLLAPPPQAPYPTENMTSPLAAMAANLNKRALSPHHHEVMSPEQKKARIQNSMRILKDEPVPEGYLRFRFNEDCQYQHCGYREHQTHFHCQRQDCGYSFCDKTRFVQHTARHERLDTLMGGDFQQYRANVACGRPDCAYTNNLGSTQNKASHFHCLKCDFVCTDTNKVVAHRRQHQKLDSIQAAGFEKFTPSQHCRAPSCQHSGKQTHYHCLSCQYAVLGLAQMSAHKYRHMEG
nr:zinc finger protein castor homolog 1-like isoform X1 [Onthophagus taurus]